MIAILTAWVELRNEAIAVHQEIDRTESTIIEANNLLFLLSNAEIGVREYPIVKKPDFLQPYQQARANLSVRCAVLLEMKVNSTSIALNKEFVR